MRAAGPTRRNLALLLVLLAVQLVLMSGSARSKDGSTLLESGVMRATSPFVRMSSAIGGAIRGAATGVRETWNARAENRHLRGEVLDLRRRLAELKEGSEETERLRALLRVREETVPDGVVARVLARTQSKQAQILVVDRGTDDGVTLDCPVVAYGGVVGRVVFADTGRAKVLLVTDPNSSIAGIVQRGRVEGMVVGQGEDPLAMDYVSGYEDVVLGDRVVTSGMDGIFPKGFGLGRVTYVSDVERISKTIRLKPAVDPRSLEEVVVLPDRGLARWVGTPEREPTR